ncbi:uncharacterized protein Tco025E_03055, partial [Trypanosoma conorhini]
RTLAAGGAGSARCGVRLGSGTGVAPDTAGERAGLAAEKVVNGRGVGDRLARARVGARYGWKARGRWRLSAVLGRRVACDFTAGSVRRDPQAFRTHRASSPSACLSTTRRLRARFFLFPSGFGAAALTRVCAHRGDTCRVGACGVGGRPRGRDF